MIHHGQKTVTAAGTAVPLTSTSVKCYSFTIQPLSTNTGEIRLGGRLWSAPNTPITSIPSGYGLVLNPGDSAVGFPAGPPGLYDLNQIYIDATNNNDGVQFIAIR